MTAGHDLDRQGGGEVVPVSVMPGRARDASADVQAATRALQRLETADSQADVAITWQTAVVVTGSSVAETLRDAAAFAERSPTVEVHSLAWARVPGPVVDSTEFRLTMTVSYPDARGEFSGSTDHAPRR